MSLSELGEVARSEQVTSLLMYHSRTQSLTSLIQHLRADRPVLPHLARCILYLTPHGLIDISRSDQYQSKATIGVAGAHLNIHFAPEQYGVNYTATLACAGGWMQGLSKLYEKSERWDEYAETQMGLVKLFAKMYVPLMVRCASATFD